jgi:pilus assembly protein CpaF
MSLFKRLGNQPQLEPTPTAASTPPPTAAAVAPAPPPPPPVPTTPTPAPTRPTVQDATPANDQKRMLELSLWIVDRIQASLGNQTELKRSPETERLLQERFARIYQQANVHLSDQDVKKLFAMVCDELFGFGPLQPLLDDDTISEVMVNGPNKVYIEQKGKLKLTDVRFASDEHVLKIIDRIIRPLGRRIDRKWPMVDARLPDGSRVNAIIPPCAIDGCDDHDS